MLLVHEVQHTYKGEAREFKKYPLFGVRTKELSAISNGLSG
jgi:hypothetical protein